jgi:hypothetical protein
VFIEAREAYEDLNFSAIHLFGPYVNPPAPPNTPGSLTLPLCKQSLVSSTATPAEEELSHQTRFDLTVEGFSISQMMIVPSNHDSINRSKLTLSTSHEKQRKMYTWVDRARAIDVAITGDI